MGVGEEMWGKGGENKLGVKGGLDKKNQGKIAEIS